MFQGGKEPEIEIDVKLETLLGEKHLHFSLTSRIPGKESRKRRLTHQLKQDPGAFFHRLTEIIDAGAKSKKFESSQLEDLGHNLFEQLLPKALKDLLWSCREGDYSLLIESNETDIPWRLIKLVGWERGIRVEGKFLCEAYRLSQWTTTQPLRSQLQLSPMLVTMGDIENMSQVETEFSAITRAVGPAKGEKPDREKLKALLKQALFKTWHHVGHGLAPENANDSVRLKLYGGEMLEPTLLDGEAGNMGAIGPMVVLNCCHVGRGGAHLAEAGGWSRAVLNTGAAAFIGTGWSVNNQAAIQFAEHFYTALVQGVPLAEAMRQTRRALKMLGGADWLTYTLYGHPLAQVIPEKRNSTTDLQTQWESQTQSASDGQWKTVLTLLAVIKAPVSPALLAQFAGLDQSQVQTTLNSWRPWLDVEPGSLEKFKAGPNLIQHMTALKAGGEIDFEAAHLKILRVLQQVKRPG